MLFSGHTKRTEGLLIGLYWRSIRTYLRLLYLCKKYSQNRRTKRLDIRRTPKKWSISMIIDDHEVAGAPLPQGGLRYFLPRKGKCYLLVTRQRNQIYVRTALIPIFPFNHVLLFLFAGAAAGVLPLGWSVLRLILRAW